MLCFIVRDLETTMTTTYQRTWFVVLLLVILYSTLYTVCYYAFVAALWGSINRRSPSVHPFVMYGF